MIKIYRGNKKLKGFKLTLEAISMLEKMAKSKQLSNTALIENLIRKEAENIDLDSN